MSRSDIYDTETLFRYLYILYVCIIPIIHHCLSRKIRKTIIICTYLVARRFVTVIRRPECTRDKITIRNRYVFNKLPRYHFFFFYSSGHLSAHLTILYYCSGINGLFPRPFPARRFTALWLIIYGFHHLYTWYHLLPPPTVQYPRLWLKIVILTFLNFYFIRLFSIFIAILPSIRKKNPIMILNIT